MSNATTTATPFGTPPPLPPSVVGRPPPPPGSMASDGPGSLPGSASVAQPPGFAMAVSHYKDNAVELTSLQQTSYDATPLPCEGHAVVITKRGVAETGNGACPREWGNVSCSCLAGGGSSSEWAFQLTKLPSTSSLGTAAIPATFDAATTTLAVTTIGRFALSDHVTLLRLQGVTTTSEPLTFTFDLKSPYDQGGPAVSLVEAKSANYITEVEVANINFAGVDITEDFLPSSVTTLTLRNCKLTTLPTTYLARRWDKLTTLDLSGNQLSSWVTGDATGTVPAVANAILSLNLSGNAFATIPSSFLGLTSLQTLNFSNNPITNLTVSDALYNKIASLETFLLDGINASSVVGSGCGVGASVKTAHSISFCVQTASAAAPASSSASEGQGSHSTLVYVAIAGGVVIVALVIALFVMHHKRKQQARAKAFSRTYDNENATSPGRDFASIPSDRVFQTLTLHSGQILDPPLLSDPLILTSRLDRKEIRLAELRSQGGFGIVYSGVYRRRRVAVKMLRSEYTTDAKLVESFLKEIALMASLSHPRIVEYIGCAWDNIQNLAMITELMDRGDLRDVLQHFKQRNTPLTWSAHKTRFALHIAEGLQYLHTLSPKIVHRDLKAKNVLVNSELDAKLTDFGISREGRFEQTHMTAGIGTSFWIAPEVLMGLKYDERADIFSFGVVLSEIDTDDYPYWDLENEHGALGTTTQDQILCKVMAGEMRPRFTRECPPTIRLLANKCLEGEASKRPSASEIVQFLAPVAYSSDPDVPVI